MRLNFYVTEQEQGYRDILADYEKIREAVNRKLMRELNLLIQQSRLPKRREGCGKQAVTGGM